MTLVGREAGRTLVGVFDFITPAHLRLFTHLRDSGSFDVLVLGDQLAASVIGTPPLTTWHDRCEIVAHIRGVDDVRVVDDIEQLRLFLVSQPAEHLIAAADEPSEALLDGMQVVVDLRDPVAAELPAIGTWAR